jgi:hypothetical protein
MPVPEELVIVPEIVTGSAVSLRIHELKEAKISASMIKR